MKPRTPAVDARCSGRCPSIGETVTQNPKGIVERLYEISVGNSECAPLMQQMARLGHVIHLGGGYAVRRQTIIVDLLE